MGNKQSNNIHADINTKSRSEDIRQSNFHSKRISQLERLNSKKTEAAKRSPFDLIPNLDKVENLSRKSSSESKYYYTPCLANFNFVSKNYENKILDQSKASISTMISDRTSNISAKNNSGSNSEILYNKNSSDLEVHRFNSDSTQTGSVFQCNLKSNQINLAKINNFGCGDSKLEIIDGSADITHASTVPESIATCEGNPILVNQIPLRLSNLNNYNKQNSVENTISKKSEYNFKNNIKYIINQEDYIRRKYYSKLQRIGHWNHPMEKSHNNIVIFDWDDTLMFSFEYFNFLKNERNSAPKAKYKYCSFNFDSLSMNKSSSSKNLNSPTSVANKEDDVREYSTSNVGSIVTDVEYFNEELNTQTKLSEKELDYKAVKRKSDYSRNNKNNKCSNTDLPNKPALKALKNEFKLTEENNGNIYNISSEKAKFKDTDREKRTENTTYTPSQEQRNSTGNIPKSNIDINNLGFNTADKCLEIKKFKQFFINKLKLISNIQQRVFRILEQAISLSDVFIISNASLAWIYYSAELFFPEVYEKLLSKVKLISARDHFMNDFTSAEWKKKCFSKVAKYYRKDKLTNIVVIGDSPLEIEAAEMLFKKFNSPSKTYLKTIKFKERPSLEVLHRQLELIENSFSRIFNQNKSVNIVVNQKSENNQNTKESKVKSNNTKVKVC